MDRLSIMWSSRTFCRDGITKDVGRSDGEGPNERSCSR